MQGVPRTAGALDPSLHLQETQCFPKAVPPAWKNRNLRSWEPIQIVLDVLKESQPHTHNPGKAQKSRRCRAWFGAPGNGSATSPALGGRALGTHQDSLLPPDPLEFQPQTLPAHRFWIRWVTSVTSQLCWGFREAAEASALWSRAQVAPGDPTESPPDPWRFVQHPWKQQGRFPGAILVPVLCSSSAASTCSPPLRNIPCLPLWCPHGCGTKSSDPTKGEGEQHSCGNPPS